MKTEAISGRREYLTSNSPGLESASTVSISSACQKRIIGYDRSSAKAIEPISDRVVVSRSQSVELTLRQQVEFVNEQSLVLSPGEIECLGGEELWDTILLVVSIVLQLRNTVHATGLEAREGGGRFLDKSRLV